MDAAHPRGDGLYAVPRPVTDLGSCVFHHAIDLPGYGAVPGGWDLRAGIVDYLGHVAFAGKRALDVGTTSGFLSFAMEAAGAEVVSYDLAQSEPWDVVPFPGLDRGDFEGELRNHLDRIEDAYWLSHAALGSRARLARGSFYAIPLALGPVDVAVFGTTLVRMRDPFSVLQSAARLTRETLVVTEILPRPYRFVRYLRRRVGLPMFLLPRAASRARFEAWWVFAPATIQEFLRILGFGESAVTYHHQLVLGRRQLCYTVVGRRTEPTNPRG
ncbi:hypothetical protein OPKNFCMD_3403 [Methylobacterium crusticola]|uniref:Methyltransferase domain-containing protein n=1 Tax=Methylobacterium crusticola TaxID=1697972 RepID=A0ABQ4R0M3_9HYPH|nr:hypothetical protein [Methylobacterium crusticola]GJD50660.1 hypothetical protein OPKNFCMD_3403 [Methylobacterium crusticola]